MHHVGPYRFTRTDARRTFGALGGLWRAHVHGLDDVPDAAVERATSVAARLEAVLGAQTSGRGSADAGPGPARRGATDPGDRLDGLGADAVGRIDDGSWDDERIDAELEAAWVGIRLVGDELRRSGHLMSPSHPAHSSTGTTGSVAQLSTSSGGVPKRAVPVVDVDHRGVRGDRQATRQHHGRPWQALCLWSIEVIEQLAAAGHPISAGAAGENITIAGIDWSLVRPGVILDLGDIAAGGVQCEISSYATPCAKNARWFRAGEFSAMHHERGDVSRVYATVLRPGRVSTGDAVRFGA